MCRAWLATMAYAAMATCLVAQAAEPEIRGPDEIVPIGRSCWLEVDGVSVEQLQQGSVDVFPKGYDTDLRILMDLRGTILIWFSPSEANALQQYDLLLIAPYLDGDQPKLHRLTWTIRTGQSPGPDPPPPPPPGKIARAVIVWESGESTQPLNALLQNLRDNRSLSQKLVLLDKDVVDERDKPDPLVGFVLERLVSQRLPVIAGLSESGSLVFAEELPSTAAEVEDLLRTNGMDW